METERTNLFFTLLKLKSYLVSLLDNPSEAPDDFTYTREYLERRYPDKLNEIIDLLEDNGIFNDSEIAFNEKVILKFRTIANNSGAQVDLMGLLNKLEIEAKEIGRHDKARSKFINKREEKLNDILEILFQLATNWAILRELEDKADNYSALTDEDVIRPDEEKNLDALDDTTSHAFAVISELTKKYIHKLTDFYFTYGGNIALKDFIEDLENTKKSVGRKYADLFKQYGLDSDWIEKNSDK